MSNTPPPRDIARLIAAIEHQLKQTPPRPLQVGYAREILLALKAMRAQQDELWRLRDLTSVGSCTDAPSTVRRELQPLSRGWLARVGSARTAASLREPRRLSA
jgi:hypothetical protein